jgi:hypothetical protein
MAILLISASWVAWISDMRHQHLATCVLLIKLLIQGIYESLNSWLLFPISFP